MVATYIGTLIGGLLYGLILWIVDKLNLGISFTSYLWAVVMGFIISALANLIHTLVPAGGMFTGAIAGLLITALAIWITGSVFKQMTVNGFLGAAVASIAIGVVQFLLVLVVGGLVGTAV